MILQESIAVRLCMGIVIGVAVFSAVIWLDTRFLTAIFAVGALWLIWEWACLCDSRKLAWIYPVLTICLWSMIFVLFQDIDSFIQWLFTPILYASIAWWFGMFIILVAYQNTWQKSSWLGWYYRIGLVFIPSTSLFVVFVLHYINMSILVYLLGIVALVDTAAYLSGKYLGNKKFMPEISPNKTYAGLWGALSSVTLVAIVFSFYFADSVLGQVNFLLVSLIVAVFCIVGDFSESLLKRRSGVKDSGHILPGHGGFFDRGDSFLAAAPMFVFTYYVIA